MIDDVDQLLGAGVLGDSLGSLRDGVLGELTREEESDSSLDLARGDGGPLVVVGESAGLSSDPLEQIVDERVHDAHGLGGDASVRVDLLQHLVDVDGVGLLPSLLLLLLVSLGDGLGGLAGLLGGFSRNLGWHDDIDALSMSEELMMVQRKRGYLCTITQWPVAVIVGLSHDVSANRNLYLDGYFGGINLNFPTPTKTVEIAEPRKRL